MTESLFNQGQRTAGQPSAVRGQVKCHSGYEYAQRPVAFSWEGERLDVEEIIASWRHPEGKCFRVQTDSEQVFELCYNENLDIWSIKAG